MKNKHCRWRAVSAEKDIEIARKAEAQPHRLFNLGAKSVVGAYRKELYSGCATALGDPMCVSRQNT
jgi:hypothetical protein